MILKILAVTLLASAVISLPVAVTKNSPQCDLCITGLEEFKIAATDPYSEDLQKVITDFICSKVPIEDCDNWVNKQFGYLNQDVAKIDPPAACAKMGACKPHTSRLEESKTCEFCEFVGENLSHLLGNNTVDEIVDTVVILCHAELPQFLADQCEAVVKYYGHTVVEHLFNEVTVKEVCTSMGLCSEDVRHMIAATDLYQTITKDLKNDDGCKACKDGVNELKMLISSPDMIDLLHIAVKEVCGVIQTPLCEVLVDTALDQMIKKAIPFLDADKICSGVCTKETAVAIVEDNVRDVTPQCEACTDILGEIKKVAGDPGTDKMINDISALICTKLSIPFCQTVFNKLIKSEFGKLKKINVEGTCAPLCSQSDTFEDGLGDTCSECSMIANAVLATFEDEAVDDLIKEGINEVCSVIPIKNCAEEMDKYVDMVFELIKNMDGKTICSYLGFCGGVPKIPVQNLQDTCEMCTTVADEVITMLKSEKDMIQETADELCSLLPIPDCKETMDNYIKMIFGFIDTLDGKTVCSMIGMCGAKRNVSPMKDVQFGECDICTLVSDELLTALKNDQIEAMVKQGVEQVCSVIPLPNCASMVDNYVDMAFSMLKNLDGKTVCTWIGMCSGGKLEETPVQNLQDTCEMCTTVADEVITMLKSEKDMIQETADELCSLLPIPDCKETMDNYIKMIFGFIDTLDGKTVCSMIGMCGAEREAELTLEDSCLMCSVFADEFLYYIKSDSMRSIVKEGAEGICEIFPGIVSCTFKMDNTVDKIFNMIGELEGKDLCKMFGVCGGSALQAVDADMSCIGCQYWIDLVLEIIRSDPDFKRLAREAVDDWCAMSSVPNCKEIVGGYSDAIVDWIDNMDGQTFCRAAALCPTEVSLESIQEVLCPECKSIVNIILSELLIPSNWALIEFSLEEACTVLPIPGCRSKIHDVIEKIHVYIKGLNGTTVCQEIGLCAASAPCSKVGDVCSECSWVVGEIIALATNDQLDGIIKSLMETFCAVLPIPSCAHIADSIVDTIVEEIKNMDPKTLCGYIGLC